MKKPKITLIECGMGYQLCVEGVYEADIDEAYSEMIDALIEARAQLTIALSHEEKIPTRVLVDLCTEIEQALEKAGAIDE